MRRLAAVICLCVPAASVAAQGTTERAEGLAAPRPPVASQGRPAAGVPASAGLADRLSPPPVAGQRAAPDTDAGDEEPVQQEAGEPWSGPRVELAYVRYTLSDARNGGGVEGGQFSGYLNVGPVRLGIGAELGLRDFSLAGTDVLLRGIARAGYQHVGDLEPVMPYIVAVGTYGVVLGKRFHSPFSQSIAGLGLELGADLNLVGSFFVGVGLGYLRAEMRDLGYDVLVLRLRLGL